jgi:sigma-B regulation protein RsbU (phosphoserine phosphatase)
MASLNRMLLVEEIPSIPGLDVAVRARLREERFPMGEFVDVFELPSGLGIAYFAIAYGDVAGPATGASSMAVAAKYLLRGLAMRNPSPAWVASRLNDVLFQAFQQERILTLVYALYDPAEHKLALCNCGSWSPILVRRGKASLLDHSGALLGVFADQHYQQTEMTLAVGDLLVGYTDGLLEARRGEEVMGIDRVRAILEEQDEQSTAASVAERLLAAAQEFSDGPLNDNAVVITVRALA